MDQTIGLMEQERGLAIERLSQFVTASIENACASEQPFFHLRLDRVFPDDVYRMMLEKMPVTADYRPMSGRRRNSDIRDDGTPTRVKIDLFPEYVRRLPPDMRSVWDIVGTALRSSAVKEAFVRRLAPGLEQRFGSHFARVGLYPVPVLTRDVAGYSINIHSDAFSKGITVQFYLPRDHSITHIGTVFHRQLSDGSRPRDCKMEFAPNTGYAFAVTRTSHHSVDLVGPEVATRDSILLTYFVEEGLPGKLVNRGKRIGNYLLSRLR